MKRPWQAWAVYAVCVVILMTVMGWITAGLTACYMTRLLLLTFHGEFRGTEEQRAMFLEKLVSGEWAGTMVLTEPQAGSDVGNRHLATAIRHIERAEYAAAIRILTDLIADELHGKTSLTPVDGTAVHQQACRLVYRDYPGVLEKNLHLLTHCGSAARRPAPGPGWPHRPDGVLLPSGQPFARSMC